MNRIGALRRLIKSGVGYKVSVFNDKAISIKILKPFESIMLEQEYYRRILGDYYEEVIPAYCQLCMFRRKYELRRPCSHFLDTVESKLACYNGFVFSKDRSLFINYVLKRVLS